MDPMKSRPLNSNSRELGESFQRGPFPGALDEQSGIFEEKISEKPPEEVLPHSEINMLKAIVKPLKQTVKPS